MFVPKSHFFFPGWERIIYLAINKPLTTNSLLFWPQIGVIRYKPPSMKTILNYLKALITPFETHKEKMSGLIPVRVITKVYRDYPGNR